MGQDVLQSNFLSLYESFKIELLARTFEPNTYDGDLNLFEISDVWWA